MPTPPNFGPPEDRPESSRFFHLGPREDQGQGSGGPNSPSPIEKQQGGGRKSPHSYLDYGRRKWQ